VAGVGMARMIRAIMPFFIVELLVLLIITFVPGIVTFLPEMFGF
jgi:TRAP-type C4-dicarboxylate transport system permease large subunit